VDLYQTLRRKNLKSSQAIPQDAMAVKVA